MINKPNYMQEWYKITVNYIQKLLSCNPKIIFRINTNVFNLLLSLGDLD